MKLRFTVLSDSQSYAANQLFGSVKEVDTDNIDELKYIFTQTCHSPYIWKSNRRSDANFESTDAILLDFDESITVDEFKSSILAKFNYILYASKSHKILSKNKISDRFHVLFPIQTNTNSEYIKNLIVTVRNLTFQLGYKADKCIDLARFFFPSRQSGTTIINEYFDEVFTVSLSNTEITLDRVNQIFVDLELDNFYVDEDSLDSRTQKVFIENGLDNTTIEANVKNALDLLMANGNSLDHDERFIIAAALFNKYKEQGRSLLLGIKNSEGTRRCWDSVKSGRYSNISLGSLFYIAKRFGFEYKSGKELEKDKLIKSITEDNRKQNTEIAAKRKALDDLYKLQLDRLETDMIIEESRISSERTIAITEVEMKETSKQRLLVKTSQLNFDYDNKINSIKYKKLDREAKLASWFDSEKSKLDILEDKMNRKTSDLLASADTKAAKMAKAVRDDDDEKLIFEMNQKKIKNLLEFVPDYSEIWQQKVSEHPECKIFLQPEASKMKLIKFDNRGITGAVAKVDMQWSGVVEQTDQYTYKISTGIYSSTGRVIYSETAGEKVGKIILNNEFDKDDEFYTRGIIRAQYVPKLSIIKMDNEGFEKVFEEIYGPYSKFLYQFLSMVVFEDRKDARPTVIFTGARSTGKTLFMDILSDVYSDSVSDYREGQFNSHLLSKIVRVDEKYTNRKLMWDAIKASSGNKEVDIELKGQTPIRCDSISYFIVASNDRPIKVTEAPDNDFNNQVYAITLLKSIERNKTIISILREESAKEGREIKLFTYLTERLGHWLDTKGRQIFLDLVKERLTSTYRYGLRVPITKTLLDWCSVATPTAMKAGLVRFSDEWSRKDTITRKAFEKGYFIKSTLKDLSLDLEQQDNFYNQLKDKNLISKNYEDLIIDSNKYRAQKIINSYQLLIWMKGIIDDNIEVDNWINKFLLYDKDGIHCNIVGREEIQGLIDQDKKAEIEKEYNEIISKISYDAVDFNFIYQDDAKHNKIIEESMIGYEIRDSKNDLNEIVEIKSETKVEAKDMSNSIITEEDKQKFLDAKKRREERRRLIDEVETKKNSVESIVETKVELPVAEIKKGDSLKRLSDFFKERNKIKEETELELNINDNTSVFVYNETMRNYISKLKGTTSFIWSPNTLDFLNRSIEKRNRDEIIKVFKALNILKEGRRFRLALSPEESNIVNGKFNIILDAAVSEIITNQSKIQIRKIYNMIDLDKTLNEWIIFKINKWISAFCPNLILLLKELDILLYDKDAHFNLIYYIFAR